MLPVSLFRTILLSVISLLNEPNTFSPANVDASVMYRKWRDTNGRDDEYHKIIRSVCLLQYIGIRGVIEAILFKGVSLQTF